MKSSETPRQKKINKALQKELAVSLQATLRQGGVLNVMLSVSKVSVSPDLSSAKVYLSIFPSNQASPYLSALERNASSIRHALSQRMKNQLRRVPELTFFIDDALDHIESIENALEGKDNPILKAKPLPKKK